MEKITFVAHVTEYLGNQFNTWRTVRVTSKTEFPNSHAFHGRYVGLVSGDTLDGIPMNRDINFTVEIRGKYINCLSWNCIVIKDIKQIQKFLKQKLFTEPKETYGQALISYANICKMVAAFKEDTLEMFEKGETNKLMRYFDNNATKLVKACDIINGLNCNDRFYSFMAEHGVNRSKAAQIWEEFGPHAESIVRNNPFICLNVNGIGFKTCDNIARSLNVALDSPERIIAATVDTIEMLTNSTCNIAVPVNEVCHWALKSLNDTRENVTQQCWVEVMETERKEDISRFVYFDKRMMLRRDNDNEKMTSRKICNLLLSDMNENETYTVAKRINEQKMIKLSEKQMEAVKTALNNRVAVITGGPGTGKTTVVKTIVEAYKKGEQNQVVCMAPTGKASSRMSEATGEDAHTIHKTLNLIPGLEEAKVNVLPDGLIIVDELSMIDQETMTQLMGAVPSNGHIIFCGDIDQLPSVGKGDVLNQLIKSDIVPVARLTETFRQKKGSLIIDNALKVNTGKTDLIYDDESFQFFEMKDSDIEKFKTLYMQKVEQYGIENVMVLCPMRRYREDKPLNFVSDRLNSILQEMINPLKEGDIEATIRGNNGRNNTFRVNDRIMQWKNRSDSSNGDIGVIKSMQIINDQPMFVIEWEIDGTQSTYTQKEMEDITLAYSMSIHKSQGSEAACVIMPIMTEHRCPLFKRNLLYTGITRAKRECIIVGDKPAVDTCIKTTETGKRISYLSDRMKKYYSYNVTKRAA